MYFRRYSLWLINHLQGGNAFLAQCKHWTTYLRAISRAADLTGITGWQRLCGCILWGGPFGSMGGVWSPPFTSGQRDWLLHGDADFQELLLLTCLMVAAYLDWGLPITLLLEDVLHYHLKCCNYYLWHCSRILFFILFFLITTSSPLISPCFPDVPLIWHHLPNY